MAGHRKLAMETLRGIYIELGYTNVRSYVQSGNVVFESLDAAPPALVKQIETAIEAKSGYRVPVFIRQAHELQHILENNPFLSSRNEDPARLHVSFLYASPPETAWSKVVVPPGVTDEFAPRGSAIYLFCPNGYGMTKLSNGFFERKLGVLVTTRNWNTVKALYKMVME